MPLRNTLVACGERCRHLRRPMPGSDEVFRKSSGQAVSIGQSIAPRDHDLLADAIDPARNLAQERQVAAVIVRTAPTLPTHAEAPRAAMVPEAADA